MDVSWNSFNSFAMLKINYLIFRIWGCERNMNRSHGMLSVFKKLQSAFQMIFGTQIILTWKYSYIEYFKLLIKILFGIFLLSCIIV
jgi:hypothetical protein